jgi:hypothetical protein
MQHPVIISIPLLLASLLVSNAAETSLAGNGSNAGPVALEDGFRSPPPAARLHAYWWWLNGNVTKEAITRDLEAMKDKGFGGALIIDAGGANQDGNRQVPHGPDFASPQWRELYRHALREAARLKIELALNIQSGWNLGGPDVLPADAAKILCWSETVLSGPGSVSVNLPPPPARQGLLEEVAVIAVPERGPETVGGTLTASSAHPDYPAGHAGDGRNETFWVSGGATLPDGAMAWLRLTFDRERTVSKLVVSGRPRYGPKTFEIVAIEPAGARRLTATASAGPDGGWTTKLDPPQRLRCLEIRVIDAHDTAPVAGKPRNVQIAELSVEGPGWQWPAQAGATISHWEEKALLRPVAGANFEVSFLVPQPATNAPALDCATVMNLSPSVARGGRLHWNAPPGTWRVFRFCFTVAPRAQVSTCSEGWNGLALDPLDAAAFQRYWDAVVEPLVNDAHETVWDNLKPNFDRALCEGLNQLVWTLVTCSPREAGMPGQEMFPGTHFNPNSTWWRQSEGFLNYINRCQWMLRQGRFVADVLYYYGDLAPNFAGLKSSNPAGLPPGYDYDVATEYVILNRLSVANGRLVLPDGMSYAALVLPPHRTISLPVLRKLGELARAGAVIIGQRPETSSGLKEWQTLSDHEARSLIQQLWPRMIPHTTAAAWLKQTGLPADFSVPDNSKIDYIHRRAGETDIYFIANPGHEPIRATAAFRVAGRAPECWDAVTGDIRVLAGSRATADGRIEVPLALEAFGSAFVVFRNNRAPDAPPHPTSVSAAEPVLNLTGPWQLSFDPAWFYPDNGTRGKVVFEQLEDWTKHPEPAIRHFSGAAVYQKTFALPAALVANKAALSISLGEVREMARVNLNDHDLGVAWCPPWTVKAPPGILRAEDNLLAIEVVNFWPNRLIGDARLPRDQRRTSTNITKFDDPKGDPHYTTLMPSGLLGPVTIRRTKTPP